MARRVAGLLIAGVSLILAIAIYARLPLEDTLILAGLGAGAATVAGFGGALALRRLGWSSVAAQISLVSLTALAAVATGVVIAARQMFISSHDLWALVLILTAAGTVGVVISLWLAHRVARDARLLEDRARRLGSGEGAEGVPKPFTRELESVATRLDAMADQLFQASERERSLDASRRELVAWVSHDLRTPLAGIRAMAEALEDRVVAAPEDVAQYHRNIRVEVDRLAGLVDDLFELSRINSGTLRLRVERISLNELISDTLAAASATARAKGVSLLATPVISPAILEISTQEMVRVFRNLIENAIRHTPSDGSIFVEADVRDERAYVSVKDGCGGIPDDDLDRVFDLAFRGEAARTPEAGGAAGLGLAIAKGIVAAHDGDIHVSNEEAGCRFTVSLPLRQGNEETVTT